MWSRCIWILALGLSLALTGWGVIGLYTHRPSGSGSQPPPFTNHHVGVSIADLQELAELTILKVDLADVQETTLTGNTGTARATLLIAGDARIGTDLAKAKIIKCDEATRTLVLQLPLPVVQSVRLDHARTRLTSIRRTGLWRLMPSEETRTDLVNAAFAEAQRQLEKAAGRLELREKAQAKAEAILRDHLKVAHWDLGVDWR
ncbi:DUF4230 domain-containing protein [Humisphaera borealis]|uniref:DUF4230 domain-containing protein n=1 Tax=Humisphaera borealis TaxID=2807512 RepID=A0A7M2WSK6_9BACT|nr:DUF4230 domain-containing protein [Humisphaera borealis]QOV88446.1 DUF4230 domain-containing protein [Humisphaera borealis]